MHELYFGKSPETDRVVISDNVLAQVTEILTNAGYLRDGRDFTAAFQEFIGNENFEERADSEAKWIDGPVLEYILRKFRK